MYDSVLDAQKRFSMHAYKHLLIIAFVIFTGCGLGGQTFHIKSDPLTKYASPKNTSSSVELRLTKAFRTYSWDAPTGLPYTLELGDCLSSNAQALCKSIFKDVTVTHGTETAPDCDLILVPEVVFLDKTQAAFGFQMIEIEIHVQWTLLNDSGKILWIETVKGFGREKMGGPFSFEKNTRKQIRMAMTDMFDNSRAAIVNAFEHI